MWAMMQGEGQAMMAPEQNATTRLIEALWHRNAPQVLERLTVLDDAARGAETGALSPKLRGEAISLAHKLAGSLGMFGFNEGTEIARAIELELEAPELTAGRLTLLTMKLRGSLFPTSRGIIL